MRISALQQQQQRLPQLQQSNTASGCFVCVLALLLGELACPVLTRHLFHGWTPSLLTAVVVLPEYYIGIT